MGIFGLKIGILDGKSHFSCDKLVILTGIKYFLFEIGIFGLKIGILDTKRHF